MNRPAANFDEKNLRNCMLFSVFTAEDEWLSTQIVPLSRWYDEIYPLIDSDEERVKQRVYRIKAKKFGYDGEIEVEWLNHYGEDGSIVESWEWRGSDTPKYVTFPLDL